MNKYVSWIITMKFLQIALIQKLEDQFREIGPALLLSP